MSHSQAIVNKAWKSRPPYLCQVCNWIVCCGISTNNAVRKYRIAPGNIIFLFWGKRNANSTTGGIPLLINGIA